MFEIYHMCTNVKILNIIIEMDVDIFIIQLQVFCGLHQMNPFCDFVTFDI